MANVPMEAVDADWPTWWESIQRAFPALFDGSGPAIGRAMAEAAEELVWTAQRLEDLNGQLRANSPSSLALVRKYAPDIVQPVPTAEEDAAKRRQVREDIVTRLRRHS